MDAAGENPPRSGPSASPAGADRARRVLERTEVMHRGSAARLRRMGHDDLADRAERFAEWARFELDEPRAAGRLYAAARQLRGVSRPGPLFVRIVEGALSLGRADLGNLQLVNPETGSLVIVAQHGFGAAFLDYFAVVDGGRTACGRAARQRTQTVIFDVSTDPAFAPHRAIAAESGFRAVLSTPLLDRDGALIGVVSTHYRRPCYPPARDRQAMKRYGELAGRVVAGAVAGVPDGRAGHRSNAANAFGAAARAHDNTAEAHERSIRVGVGDAAEHRRLAERHRAAAEADRQRGGQAAMGPPARAWPPG